MLKKEVPVRSYTGNKWKTNKTNKKYLAIDFNHRCAYCDDMDSVYGGAETYGVEHFAPKEKFPELEFCYDNLLYSCPFCNGSKNDDWPSNDSSKNVVGNSGYVDPCTDEYYNHLERNEKDGKITYKTELGKYMYEHLKLFLMRHSAIYMMEKLYLKQKELEKSIEDDEKNGLNVDKKKSALDMITKEFFLYYGKLSKLDT